MPAASVAASGRRVATALEAAGVASLAYDLRGHGDSGDADADRLPPFAADVAAMIDALPALPVVVGASLGGLAALLALGRPGVSAAGLVLVDVVPDPPPASTRRFLGSRAHAPLVGDILGRAAQLRASTARLALPVMLIRGGEGSPMCDADELRLKTLLPHADVTTIASAGHLVARDEPAALARALVGFCAGCYPRTRTSGEAIG
jgi:pimeloyl-ACP methyl ester carboxylesterase